MDQFREFLLKYRIQDFALGFPIQMIVNSAVMWLVVNKIQTPVEKVSIWRCALCSVLLYLVSVGAISLLLIPVPIILIASVVVWIVGSILVIRSIFELTEGGWSIMVLYLLFLAALEMLLHKLRQ